MMKTVFVLTMLLSTMSVTSAPCCQFGFGWQDRDNKSNSNKSNQSGKQAPKNPKEVSPAGEPKQSPPSNGDSLRKSQDDGAGEAVSSKWLEGLIRKALPARDQPEVVVIRMEGDFTWDAVDTLSESIQSLSTNTMLKVACDREPVAIVLSINSPGGIVLVMNDIIDRLLSLQLTEGRRIVAWPRLAGSAAASVTCACKEIIVRSDCKIGAATRVIGQDAAPAPQTAMDQKLAAVDAARYRQIAELTKRDPLIIDAFKKPELRLYFKSGAPPLFATERPKVAKSKPPVDEPGWIALDDSTSMPMVLTAQAARDIGLAGPASADSIKQLVSALNLPESTPVVEIRLDTPSIKEAIRQEVIAQQDAWEKVHALTESLVNRLEKAQSKIETAIDLTAPRTAEEGRNFVRAIAQARSAIPTLKDDERKAIHDVLVPVRRVALFFRLDDAKKELRGAEQLMQTGIKHGRYDIGSVQRRLDAAREAIHDCMMSLMKRVDENQD
jgi:hypothetical protein